MGWFATGAEIPNTSVLIHQYYSSLTKHTPVHVTVDTSMEGSDSRMGIKAYVGVNFGVPRHTVGTLSIIKTKVNGKKEVKFLSVLSSLFA